LILINDLVPALNHSGNDAKVIKRLRQRLRESGQIVHLYVNRWRLREVRTPALKEVILEAIENAPGRNIQGLARDFQVLLEDLPLAILRQMWLQMDGALPHFGRIVWDWCDETYPNRWIGRGGAIAWPLWSPDLNPCDFFLWGHLQNFVYATPIANLEELTERINAAVHTINVPMLQKVQENIEEEQCALKLVGEISNSYYKI
jgi:hypothetical protein